MSKWNMTKRNETKHLGTELDHVWGWKLSLRHLG
jgi:hypothetical protein